MFSPLTLKTAAQSYIRSILSTLLLFIVSLNVPQVGLLLAQGNPPTGAIAGYIAGDFSVSERGTANYSIPISVLPGTAGMQPKLALSYDSRATNSYLGIGWSLAGLSIITRCPTTIAQDGFIDGVDFDSNDKFCLDGKRLTVVNGVYWQSLSEYRTESDTFSKIIFNSSGWFEVKTKDGLRYHYGESTDSRVEAQGRSDILSWRLNQISDTLGNQIDILYYEDNPSGQSYPSAINYTANFAQGLTHKNQLQFIYEDRPDPEISFVSGSKQSILKRLSAINLLRQGNLARQYRLDYEVGSNTYESRLIMLNECDAGNQCLNPTSFDWSNSGALGFELRLPADGLTSGYWSGNANQVNGDFDGDGLTDLANIQSDGTTNNWVALSDGDGTFTKIFPALGLNSGFWPGNAEQIGGDFNGDGLTDIANIQSDGSTNNWVALSNGNGSFQKIFPAAGLNTGFWPGNASQLSGDYDGDGLTDIANIQSDGTTNNWVALSNGNGTFQKIFPASGLNTGFWPGNASQLSGDFNGDGLTDIANIQSDGTTNNWVALSKGDGTFTKIFPASGLTTGFWAGHATQLAGDFNGDGLTDIANIQSDGTTNNWIAYSKGDGTFEKHFPVAGLTRGFSAGNANIFSSDFNGDGRSDIASIQSSGGSNNWIALSRPNGSFEMSASVPGLSLGFWSGNANQFPLDLDGDGLTDIANIQSDGTTNNWVALNTGRVPNLIESVTNGHGKSIHINYKPLTDPSVYLKHSNAVYPAVDVQGSINVVSSYQVSNGIGGTTQSSYFYRGLKATLDGRGFCGFASIMITDGETGNYTTNQYRLDFPYKSLLKRSVTRLASGIIVKELDYIWNVKNFGTNHYFQFVESTIENFYNILGDFLKSEEVNNTFDDYGNLLSQSTFYNDGQEIHTANQYDNDLNNWYLGRLRRTDTTYVRVGQPNQVRSAEFSYNPVSGLLSEEVMQPGHPSLELRTQYQRDPFGNIRFSTKSAPGIVTRSEETQYDSEGRFVIRAVNALGHAATKIYDQTFGNLLSSTDPNGLTTTYQYDNFDRAVSLINADGSDVQTYYFLADANSPLHTAYYVRSDVAGQPPTIKYFDLLDREIRVETVGFAGQKVFSDTEYNSRGQLIKKSDPYFQGASINWSTFEYDGLNRLIKTIQPGNRISTVSYETHWPNYKQTSTNPLNQKEVRYFDARDLYYRIEDNLANPIEYFRDSVGQIIEVRVSPTNRTLTSFDVRGNRTRLVSPDIGTINFNYDALGMLRGKTDNAGLSTTYGYDLLNRALTQSGPEGVSTWIYDTRPQGIGQISTINAPNAYKQEYFYDNFGRKNRSVTTIDGIPHTELVTYDAYGRQDSVQYPSGYKVFSVYNSTGYLESVKQASDGFTIWTINAQNALGQIENEVAGNGVVTRYIYYNTTGYLDRILSGINAGTEVQRLKFSFDEIGNLLWRRDINLARTESFTYDQLNRLTSTQVSGGYGTTISYDNLGNITNRSDVGTYSYGQNGAGLHAVTAIVGPKANSYTYDANGNRTSSNGASVTYTSFNKPRTIVQGLISYEYFYDPEQQHYKQIKIKTGSNPVNINKHYVAGNYEYEVKNGLITHRHYIFAGKQWVAIHTQTDTPAQSYLRYIHRDHLGSISKVTDSNAAIVERLSYDAWGLRRPSDWSQPVGNEISSIKYGFTGHEHMDDVDLINMRGRTYDPIIGRFVSADPIVQAPENLQNLNRYSYVLNNPLSYTDPSGYFFKSLFKSVSKFIKGTLKSLEDPKTWVLIAASWASPWLAGAISSALTLASGGDLGDVLKVALASAIVGVGDVGVSAFISQNGLGAVSSFVAHGAVKGLANMAQGGKFEHGFYAQAIELTIRSVVSNDRSEDGAGQSTGNSSKKIEKIDQVAGASHSDIGSGKFANGGVTESYSSTLSGITSEGSNNQSYGDLMGNLAEFAIDLKSSALSYDIKVEPGKYFLTKKLGVFGAIQTVIEDGLALKANPASHYARGQFYADLPAIFAPGLGSVFSESVRLGANLVTFLDNKIASHYGRDYIDNKYIEWSK